MQFVIFIIGLLIVGGFLFLVFRKKSLLQYPGAESVKRILEHHVLFYQRLPDNEKIRFEDAVETFLQKVRVTGIKTTIGDIDRVFVAAAAVIPIFAFKGWEYRNIHEVLLYPGSFNKEYILEGEGRNISGMVGTGALQNVMLISQEELRTGFLNHTDTSNTAIHEFVHLIDKTDGSTDGIPEVFLPQQYVLPFLRRIHYEIQEITARRSDINPYGATNEAEFLAVAAEYFFQQPEKMKERHPKLYELLNEVFTGTMVSANKKSV